MENKVEYLKKERKGIIEDYSSKKPSLTNVDILAEQKQELQYVLVSEIIEESSDTKSFILVPDKEKGTKTLLPFNAGEYISLKMFIDNEYTTRAYSLSSSPKDALNGKYRITVKRVSGGLVSNLLLDEVKVGDGLTISKPMGDFTYSKARDEENVIAIAGGSGITPFISMAHSILDGEEDYHLTVLYSVKTEEDILFKKEIEKLNRSKKVSFIITLTREEKEGYLHGHISKEMLEPYIKEFNTIFMCGPKELYKSMNDILSEFSIPRKSVHYENFNISYEPLEKKTFELKVLIKGDAQTIPCKSDETLLVSMEKAGIKAPSMCRVGVCGFCRSILIDGKVKMIGTVQTKATVDNDYIHPCVTYPESDIILKLDI